MSRFASVMILITALVTAQPRYASGTTEAAAAPDHSSYSRACRAEDLPGTWRLVKFHSPYQAKDPRAPYLFPHQLFHFSKTGGLKSAHSIRPIEKNAGKMFARIPSANSYAMAHAGIVTVRAKGTADTMETWQCVTITEDRDDPDRRVAMKRGDLVMTLVAKHGHIIFMRQLRKDAA